MFERILIVDDELVARNALATLLRREGFEVRDVSDGPAALAACATFRPDLILLDIVMPGMDGFEVCRRIKATPETRLTPVVLITGLSATEDRIRGINASADDFLSKPIDFNELLARTRSLLRLKQFTDELENAEGVLFSLAHCIEARDPYTRGHCERLAEMSARLGGRLGFSRTISGVESRGNRARYRQGSGAGRNFTEARAAFRRRNRRDARASGRGRADLRASEDLSAVLPIIRHHHERHDGSGYPDGLRGDEIPLTAAILQLADVYDALTTNRPYRKASRWDEALAIMDDEAKRGWWDRNLFDNFREMITEIHANGAAQKLGKAAG